MKNTGIRLNTGCPCLFVHLFCFLSLIQADLVFICSVTVLSLYERTCFYRSFPSLSVVGDVKYDC